MAAAGGLAMVAAGLVPGNPASADEPVNAGPAKAGKTTQQLMKLQPMGRANLGALARQAARQSTTSTSASANPRYEIPNKKRPNAVPDTRVTPARVPHADGGATTISDRFPDSLPFESITAVDSRYAFDGNQFTGEPPDQALCVGNGRVMASVNQAIAVYDRQGAQLAPTVAINEFFGIAPTINRERERPTFGNFAFDPVCLYDEQVDRWFYVVTNLEQDEFTGNFNGDSDLFIAVSATGDPLGEYAFYGLDTTNGDATDRGCPCFDDFPHIGTDANGFYISANRFSIFNRPFNGAQIHAISKRGLAANAAGTTTALPPLVSINAGPIDGDPSFTVQPATVPPGGQFAPNREYFLSTTDFDTVRESKIGIWALSNTDSLDSDSPQLRLTRNTVDSLTYAFEPNAVQREGRRPLGKLVNEPLNALDSGTNMNEVKFAAGRLWGAIGTAVGRGDSRRAGVLWVQVRPTFNDGRVDGNMVRQGYLKVPVNSLIYPTPGINADGQGTMVMSVAGPRIYPSVGYVRMDRSGVSGPVRVPIRGQRPDDGFTCYAAFVGSRDRGCRFGDYSAAVADEKGVIWMASEWIDSGPRIPFANWSTLIIRHRPFD